MSSHGKTKLESKHQTKHLTNRVTGITTARSPHDLIHSSLCMDMHRSTLVYIYIYIKLEHSLYVSVTQKYKAVRLENAPKS